MPTGYTAKICEGPQTFRDFTMQCARAFGALLSMRDEPFDAPIPDKFEPAAYYAESVEKAQAEVARLSAMSVAEARAYGQAQLDAEIKRAQDYIEENKQGRERLLAMKAEVEAWSCPGADHENLKAFMLRQLDDTLGFDFSPPAYWENMIREAKSCTPEARHQRELEQAQTALDKAQERQREAIKRAADSTKWVNDLRASLPST